MDLKSVLGEELFNQVKEKIGDKELILNDGSFIPKSRFDEVNEKKNGLQSQLDTLNGELTKLKKTSKDNEDAVSQIETLQKTIKEKEAEAVKISKKYALREALKESGAKHPDLLELKFNLDELEMDGDKIKGFDEKVKTVKETYKDLFGIVVKQGFEPNKDGANPKPNVITKDIYEANKTNREWVEKNLPAIKEAVKDGII